MANQVVVWRLPLAPGPWLARFLLLGDPCVYDGSGAIYDTHCVYQ